MHACMGLPLTNLCENKLLVKNILPPALAEEVMFSVHVSVSVCVCLYGFTQGTLYTTTTVYGVLVHQEGAICTTKA